ncbi:glycosyltransferase [Candidatus Pacearchaeota archaeon]|nr:glycosyltransferase [Candidatus Pacearchaeota archaeon]
MAILPYIYLGYMFVALYMLLLFIFIFLKNQDKFHYYPETKKKYTISVIIPAYNEESSIESTVNAVSKSNYPIEEIIVINDGSTDKTSQVLDSLSKKMPILKVITKKNSGKADSLNKGIAVARGELIAVVDSDSYPKPDAIEKMIGYFNNKNIGSVTSTILVTNKEKFIEKLQAIEYAIIAWSRKLLEFIDGIWVTPGPLALYRKDIVLKIGGFDTKNLTEDIELTWRLVHYGYKIRMATPAVVYTTVPTRFKHWFKQRIRWNMGGLQTLWKYKKDVLTKGLGSFIIPFFTISLFLGVFGIGVFLYVSTRNIIKNYFYTTYSFQAGSDLLRLDQFYITPTVLNVFGIFMFFLGLFFTIFALNYIKQHEFLKKKNAFVFMFYLIIYLTIYPFLLIASFYKFITRNYSWGTR